MEGWGGDNKKVSKNQVWKKQRGDVSLSALFRRLLNEAKFANYSEMLLKAPDGTATN